MNVRLTAEQRAVGGVSEHLPSYTAVQQCKNAQFDENVFKQIRSPHAKVGVKS